MNELRAGEETGRLFSNGDLRRLIIPLVFEQTLAVTVGIADTMMVSSVGEAAVSGVSLVDMINMLIFGVLAALATGGAVVTSQYLGAQKRDMARAAARQLVYTVLVGGLIITAVTVALRRPLLRLLFGSIEQDVMDNALIYLVISAASYPSLALYNGCAALFRSMGNARITLKVSVAVNIVNVAGNAVCIFGLHMGTAGVAVPSLISRTLGAVLLYIFLRRPDQPIRMEPGRFRWDLDAVRRILHIGVPSGVENGVFQLGRVIVVSVISGFGTYQIAANGVANNLDSFGILIGNAMNLAMITVIGRCVGAGDEAQVRYYLKKLLRVTYISQTALIALLLLNLSRIVGLYSLSPEAAALARTLVWIHNGTSIVLWPVSFVLPNMLRACNDVKYTMAVSVLSMFLFRVGFSFVLGKYLGLGAVGVWIAMVLDWTCRVICFTSRYFSGKWRELAGLDAPA